ncbi:N-acetylmuramoyl-L-alanine amidase [Arthrobacter crystallopoietes]|uniref:N-acetylmuramoyl-L-alanine amidase n=1 Tax=Crystallibacter crystallopoietes TaxID=37928 RepID=UPI001ABDB213|nr:N-acetylmuramoyl-L-alanine amidase [Arthrobacter crystallopoietes]QTG81807.1 peptidoglycan-binding protein [Arthrobacter crystallopoietes]
MDNDAADQSLRRSDTSRRVVALRERLLRAGISMAYLAPDQVNDPTVFDDHVDAAVRTFQQNRGLMVDGVAGPETLRALGEAQYNLGDRPMFWQHGIDHTRGDDVSELQRQLSYLGFYYGHIDGEFGERTHLAVRELQQNLGLEPTGVADAPLIGAMARVNRSISPSHAFSLRDYERLNQASAALKGRVVCLTAGHGTSFQSSVTDKASGRPLTEKLVASDVMRRVESILSGLGAEVTVVAAGDEKAADNRVQLIRKVSPSLSISINCDSLDQPLANGVSAFYWGKPETGEIRSPIGHRAAELVLKEVLARTTATDLGIHGRSWDILRLTSIPSIQLDIGYLSNPDEAGRLADPVFRQVLADAIVIAIQRLYLLEEDDEPTGTLALDDVRRFNPER